MTILKLPEWYIFWLVRQDSLLVYPLSEHTSDVPQLLEYYHVLKPV